MSSTTLAEYFADGRSEDELRSYVTQNGVKAAEEEGHSRFLEYRKASRQVAVRRMATALVLGGLALPTGGLSLIPGAVVIGRQIGTIINEHTGHADGATLRQRETNLKNKNTFLRGLFRFDI